MKKETKTQDVIVATFGTIVIIFLLMVVVSISTSKNICIKNKMITRIGACTKSGFCAVQFQDGGFGRLELPIVGMQGCTEISRKYFWYDPKTKQND